MGQNKKKIALSSVSYYYWMTKVSKSRNVNVVGTKKLQNIYIVIRKVTHDICPILIRHSLD